MALLFNANGNRTFSLDLEGGRQWSPIDLGSSLPSGLVSPSLVYDLRRDRLVLVLDAAGRSWALEREHPSGWGQLPAIHPAPFNYGCAVYDPRRDRIWATGATGGAASDVWSVSLANPVAWDRVSTTGYRSSPLVLSTAFYDAARDRMIIMGGYGLADTGWLSEVWALDLETLAWAQLRADSDEPSGSGLLPGSIYDPVRNRMVATTGTDYYNTGSWFLWNADLWGPTTTAWNWEWPVCGYPDDFTAYCPVLRDLPLCLYDPWVDRIIVFGGYIGSLFPPVSLDDTWALTWGTPTAAQVSLVEASATPSTAHIVWQVTDRSGAVTVQRRAAGGGEWSARGTLVPDGQGRVAYHDADVVPGTRYGYRLILSGPDGPTFHAEVWIDVPVAAAAFAIAGVHPNPSRAGFRVELSLATAEPARIEVHDIAGRLLVGRDLTGLPAGAHVIELGEAARLPAGLYFVRLRQGRQVTSSTVALVR
jgi:hypothetical protein